MWSHEVTAMTSAYTQQALQRTAYSQQIGLSGIANTGAQADMLTGMAMNRVAAVGAPLAKVATMGYDSPMGGMMTGGIMGGIGAALGGGGIMAGAMSGAAIGLPLGALVGGAAYAGNHMFAGMQQGQALNAAMRANYGQLTSQGYGFNRTDISQIGGQIRGMAGQVGQGGEMHSFGELANLAASMGRMGFAQNVTDVRQFTSKFKEMVDTMKVVSRELGTSLQAAQEMVVGMRSSGIFKQADQIKMSQMMRSSSVAAGISMEGTSSMANVGAQIARSIGGLGTSGAFAGVRTVRDVGLAMKTGALTEEDIYNSTGLTGEAGMTAMAQNQLQSSAQFLKSGRGRWLLASMAGQGGHLNQASLAEFAGGGYGVGRTRQMAGQNLGQVGRASFLRNEGRLRSEMLEKVGGNVNTLALMGWAGERGVDIESMGDREMLFAQRMLGMGRDEMDSAVKMAKGLSKSQQYGEYMGRRDEYQRGVETRRRGQGLEGIKTQFNKFKEGINSHLEQTGLDMYNDMSNWVERQIGTMLGTYHTSITKSLEDAYMDFRTNGATPTATAAMNRELFVGMRARKAVGAEGMSALGLPGMGGAGIGYDQYSKQLQGGGLGGSIIGLLGGRTVEDRMGIHFNPTGGGAGGAGPGAASYDEQLRGFMSAKDQLRAGAFTPPSEDLIAQARSMRGMLGESVNYETLIGKHGDDYKEAMNALISKGPGGSLQRQWNNAYDDARFGNQGAKEEANRQLGQIMQTVGAASGLPGAMQFGSNVEMPWGGIGSGSFVTEQDKTAAYGSALTSGYIPRRIKVDASGTPERGQNMGAGGQGVPGQGESEIIGPESETMKWFSAHDREASEASAKYMESTEGKELARVGLEGTQKDLDKLNKDMLESADKAMGEGARVSDRSEYELKKTASFMASVRLGGYEDSHMGQQRIAAGLGMTLEEAQRRSAGFAGVAGHRAGEEAMALGQRVSEMAQPEAERLSKLGLYDATTQGLSSGARTTIESLGMKGLAGYVGGKVGQIGAEINAGRQYGPEGVEASLRLSGSQRTDSILGMAEMSSANISKLLGTMGTESGGLAESLSPELRKEQRDRRKAAGLGQIAQTYGAGLGTARAMGLKLSRTEMGDVAKLKTSEQMGRYMASKGYDLDAAQQKQLELGMQLLKTGEGEIEEDTTEMERVTGAGLKKKTKVHGEGGRALGMRMVKDVADKADPERKRAEAEATSKKEDSTALRSMDTTLKQLHTLLGGNLKVEVQTWPKKMQ